jgi:Zn-dependent peptidase ImmA (M78 family)
MKVILKHTILKRLRESRTIPLAAMPSKLGILDEEYAKYENQDTKVDLEFAEKVAGVFKRNWSVFLLDELPNEKLFSRDNRTVENQTPSLHEKTIEAIEDANYILEFAGNLTTFKGLRIPKYENIKDLSPEELGVLIRKESKIDIVDQEKFKDASDAFKKWIKFVEGLGIFVSQYPLDKDDKIRAFSLATSNRAIVVLNTKDTIPGRIFSLLHELCHVLIKSSGICDFHYSKSSDTEVFCNRFAAEFLAPMEKIKSYIDAKGNNIISSDLDYHVNKLSSHLKVSQLVIYRRLATLGIITDAEYAKIHKNFLRRFFMFIRTGEETGGPNYYTVKRVRNGEFYSASVLEAYSTGEISAFEAGHALGINANNLNNYMNLAA